MMLTGERWNVLRCLYAADVILLTDSEEGQQRVVSKSGCRKEKR